MDIIEAVTIVALATLATTLVALVIERRMDVLHGPYIEGHEGAAPHILLSALFRAISRLTDQLRWKARNIIYVTLLVPF